MDNNRITMEPKYKRVGKYLIMTVFLSALGYTFLFNIARGYLKHRNDNIESVIVEKNGNLESIE